MHALDEGCSEYVVNVLTVRGSVQALGGGKERTLLDDLVLCDESLEEEFEEARDETDHGGVVVVVLCPCLLGYTR
jgi:hypothetical protein